MSFLLYLSLCFASDERGSTFAVADRMYSCCLVRKVVCKNLVVKSFFPLRLYKLTHLWWGRGIQSVGVGVLKINHRVLRMAFKNFYHPISFIQLGLAGRETYFLGLHSSYAQNLYDAWKKIVNFKIDAILAKSNWNKRAI